MCLSFYLFGVARLLTSCVIPAIRFWAHYTIAGQKVAGFHPRQAAEVSSVLPLIESHLQFPFTCFSLGQCVHNCCSSIFHRIYWFAIRKDTYGVFAEPVDPEEVCFISNNIIFSYGCGHYMTSYVLLCDICSFQITMILSSIRWILQPSGRSCQVEHMRTWNNLRSVKNVAWQTWVFFFTDQTLL